MVVFTCNHCGESLHKPKVEKHYQFQCRNYKSVTCVDCFKDFRNEEYVVHTKCLTEDERYAAKGTYKNGIVKKGEVKQESWLDMIKSICDKEKNLKPSVRQLLETISEYNNVPRKKSKFLNFIKNSSGNRVNMTDVEDVWDIIEKYKSQSNYNKVVNKSEIKKDEVEKNGIKKRESENGDHPESPKKKKKKVLDVEQNKNGNHMEDGNRQEKPDKFDYKGKILEILTEKGSISHKKLQKKILKSYISATGQNECEEKIIKKFNKTLKKLSNVSIEDDRVLLKV